MTKWKEPSLLWCFSLQGSLRFTHFNSWERTGSLGYLQRCAVFYRRHWRWSAVFMSERFSSPQTVAENAPIMSLRVVFKHAVALSVNSLTLLSSRFPRSGTVCLDVINQTWTALYGELLLLHVSISCFPTGVGAITRSSISTLSHAAMHGSGAASSNLLTEGREQGALTR